VLDPRDFVDVFSSRMPALFDILVLEPDMLTVPAHLVHSQTVGKLFNGLLARFLTDHKLNLLCKPETKEAQLVLKLYRLVFIGMGQADGEMLLIGTVMKMIQSCLDALVLEEEPLGYLNLLRILSKACQGTREPLKGLFDEAYKSGKLTALLTTYLAMLNGPNCTDVSVGVGRDWGLCC
jgi:transformation/transcription domain-associated protein